MAKIEVVTPMAKNEFPLSVPPRWVAELFSILGHIAKLKLKSQNLSLEQPTNLDVERRKYVELVLGNLENGSNRAARQWSNFRSDDVEVFLDSESNPLSRPGMDRVIPPVLSGLAPRRPRFWLELPPARATPKRPRDSASTAYDTISDLPVSKRPASLDSSMRGDMDSSMREVRGLRGSE